MSVTREQHFDCPCGGTLVATMVDSLNAGRHDHLRQQVIDRVLHAFDCPLCGCVTTVSQRFFYFDFDRRQMIGVYLPSDRLDERNCGAELVELFETHVRAEAPPSVRAVADEFLVRICFSYEELREKIIVDEAGLSDLSIEAVKWQLMLDPTLQAHGIATLRVDQAANSELRFVPEWLQGVPDDYQGPTTIKVKQAMYDGVHAPPKQLLKLYPGIASGPHVSLLRLAT